jgi:hypothetical protein
MKIDINLQGPFATYTLAKEAGRCVVTGKGWEVGKADREIVPINIYTERAATALHLGLSILSHLEAGK